MISRAAFCSTLDEISGPLRPFLLDPDVSEILINGPDSVYTEKSGALSREPCSVDQGTLIALLRVVAQYAGRRLDDESPILEARLPDGSRVEAVLAPIAAHGPCIAIRRHRSEGLTLRDMVRLGSLTAEAVQTLTEMVRAKKNILVSGGTGSGKTSLLNSVASLIASHERIVVLEDSRELQLQQAHVISLEARPADQRGRGKVTLFDLFRAALRLRPDRIVIGEIRGEEALDLIQAMTSGHGGCMSTIHASSPRDALRRLETLALMRGLDLPLPALREQVASAVHVVVQTERLPHGGRGVTEIAEIEQVLGSGVDYRMRTLFSPQANGKLEPA